MTTQHQYGIGNGPPNQRFNGPPAIWITNGTTLHKLAELTPTNANTLADLLGGLQIPQSRLETVIDSHTPEDAQPQNPETTDNEPLNTSTNKTPAKKPARKRGTKKTTKKPAPKDQPTQ